MPDNDYVPRGVHGRWRTAYRALLDGETPTVTGSLLEKAHAVEMRRRPCPGID